MSILTWADCLPSDSSEHKIIQGVPEINGSIDTAHSWVEVRSSFLYKPRSYSAPFLKYKVSKFHIRFLS